MCLVCYIYTFLKYRDHYTSNIIVAAPMQLLCIPACKYSNSDTRHFTMLYTRHVLNVHIENSLLALGLRHKTQKALSLKRLS